jgi:spore coat polysaccharide biosynthesis protein SpsF (cytidylyltransferase family)
VKTIAIVAARMNSTRLPGKVLADLDGRPVLEWVYEAAESAMGIEETWVATTNESRDDKIVQWCESKFVSYWRGSETDVLRRFAECAKAAEADVVVRLTGDCPLLCPGVIGQTVMLQRLTGASYVSNVHPPTYPDGLDSEVFTAEALYAADREARLPSDRDTVTSFIFRNSARWPQRALICPLPGLGKERWVLDTAEDYEFCKAVIEQAHTATLLTILDALCEHPELRDINRMWTRNERYYQAVASE